MIENLENTIIEPKTKIFLKICQDCNIDLKKKVLIVVFGIIIAPNKNNEILNFVFGKTKYIQFIIFF